MLFLIFAGLNAYWIMPTSQRIASADLQPSYEFSIAEIERVNTLGSPANTIQLFGGGAWREVIQTPPNDTVSFALFSLVPIFSLSSIVFFRNNRFIVLMAVLFMIIFPLSLGTSSPLPIYQWLMESPLGGLMWLFRDPFRLVQFTLMIFSFMLAFTVKRILDISRLEIRTLLVFVLATAILYSPAAYTFYNAGGNRLVSSQLPAEYQEVRQFLIDDHIDDNSNFKVLWLPLRQYQYYDWNIVDAEVSGDLYPASSPVPTYTFTTTSNHFEFWNYIYSYMLLDFRTNRLGEIFATYNVKYVVVHTDLLGWQHNEAERIINILGLQQDLTRIASFGDYHVFLNLSFTNREVNGVTLYTISEFNQYNEIIQSRTQNLTYSLLSGGGWASGQNSRISIETITQEQLLRWNVDFSESQERYETRLSLPNLNLENYDKMIIDVLPSGTGQPRIFGVVLYTDDSAFQFSRYAFTQGEWNRAIFDIRAAKLSEAGKSKDFNLKNVTGIGLVVFKQYYPFQSGYSFYLKDVSWIPDSITYDSGAMIDNWPTSALDESWEISNVRGIGAFDLSVTEPMVLALAETYDPLWTATISTDKARMELEPVVVNSVLTGFLIPEAGSYKVELHYEAQESLNNGIAISTVTAVLIGLFIYSLHHSVIRLPRIIDTKMVKLREMLSSYGFVTSEQNTSSFVAPEDLQESNIVSMVVPFRFSNLHAYLLIISLILLLATLPFARVLGIIETVDYVVLISFMLLVSGMTFRTINSEYKTLLAIIR
jgi:hypothetical protein